MTRLRSISRRVQDASDGTFGFLNSMTSLVKHRAVQNGRPRVSAFPGYVNTQNTGPKSSRWIMRKD